MLERVYARAERHDDYLRTLQRQADAVANPTERLALLRRLAAEAEKRPDGLDRAAEALEQILRIEPRDSEAFAALERIYRGADRPGALAAAMSRRLSVIDTIEAQRELLFTLAQTYEHELDDWEPALDTYGRAEVAGDVRPETYEAIDRLAERLGRWTSPPRRRASGPRSPRKTRPRWRRARAYNATTAISRRPWACSSTPRSGRRPARRRPRC